MENPPILIGAREVQTLVGIRVARWHTVRWLLFLTGCLAGWTGGLLASGYLVRTEYSRSVKALSDQLLVSESMVCPVPKKTTLPQVRLL